MNYKKIKIFAYFGCLTAFFLAFGTYLQAFNGTLFCYCSGQSRPISILGNFNKTDSYALITSICNKPNNCINNSMSKCEVAFYGISGNVTQYDCQQYFSKSPKTKSNRALPNR